MTEFIPRDIPIYMLVNKRDPIELEKARAARAEWIRFGFNNIHFQNSFSSTQQFHSFLNDFELYINPFENVIFDDNLNLDDVLKTGSFRFFIDFHTLARKLRNLNSHSIFIQHDTVITKDIPATLLNNDVNVLKLQSEYLDFKNGMLCSPSYWHAVTNYIKAFSKREIKMQLIYRNYANNILLLETLKPTFKNKKTNFESIMSMDNGYTTKL